MFIQCKGDRFIRAAIKKGLHLNKDGVLILPTGKPHGVKKDVKRRRLGLSVGKTTTVVNYARVICWLANGPPPQGAKYDAEHRNRNPCDDSPENLRWATRSTNVLNAEPYHRGPHPKYTAKKIARVKELYRHCLSYKIVSTQTGIPSTTVFRMVTLKHFKSTATQLGQAECGSAQ